MPRPYNWWEAGVVFNGLIEYSNLTSDTQYDSLISEGILWQKGENHTFMPLNQTEHPLNDDQCAWAQTAMTAAEFGFPIPNNESWVDMAIDVFDALTMRWDSGYCDVGLRVERYFKEGYDYAQTSANSDFFLLASRLARFTGNDTYAEWAEKIFDWAKEIGLITDDYNVYGARRDCTTINDIQWTYEHGLLTEGAAVMYNIVSTCLVESWNAAKQLG